jgi:hypothetical protein
VCSNGGIRQRAECRQTSDFLFNFTVQYLTLFFEPFQRPLWVRRDLALANGRLFNLFIRSNPSVRFKVCSLDLFIVCDALLRRIRKQLAGDGTEGEAAHPLWKIEQLLLYVNQVWSKSRGHWAFIMGLNVNFKGLSSMSNTHTPVDYNLSRRLHECRTETCPIRTCTAYAAHSSRNAERTGSWEVRVTQRRGSRDRGRRCQLWATKGESIIRTQD